MHRENYCVTLYLHRKENNLKLCFVAFFLNLHFEVLKYWSIQKLHAVSDHLSLLTDILKDMLKFHMNFHVTFDS